MSKPIVLNDEIKKKIIAEFVEQVSKIKMSDGKLTYSKTFSWDGDSEKITVSFMPEAYCKMVSLIMEMTDEVGWNGICIRNPDDPNDFIVKDILLYPQRVTGTTVNPDPVKTNDWTEKLTDEQFFNLRFQAHSHVNMGVTPSGTDEEYWDNIVKQLKPTDFYVFMIWNKRLEHTCRVYDMAENVMYENKDIKFRVINSGIDELLADAKTKVEKYVATTTPVTTIKPATAAPVTPIGGGAYKGSEDKKYESKYDWRDYYGYKYGAQNYPYDYEN